MAKKDQSLYNGNCVFCGQTFSKAAISRHLKACKARKEAQAKEIPGRGKPRPIMHLSVEGRYNPAYWLHVETAAGSTCGALDDFLRHIWLECCGHLSGFKFQQRRPPRSLSLGHGNFLSSIEKMASSLLDDLDEPGEEMGLPLESRVDKGDIFFYDYDYGSTTSLKLKVVTIRQGILKTDDVKLLARNLPPAILCKCGKPAVVVCPEHGWDDSGWLCQTCAQEHEADCEYTVDDMLPVVNSPRTGVCAYTGPEE